MRAFWGLLIILIGVLLLGENFSWWSHYNLNYLWHFWPLLLILLGIALIVRNLRMGWIIVLIAFLGAAGFVATFLANENLFNKISTGSNPVNQSNFSQALPEGITKGSVTIESGASSIDLGNTNDNFIDGTLNSDFFEPVLNTNQNGNSLNASLSMNTNTRFSNLGNTKNNLKVNLTNRIPLDITINTGASDMSLDLSKLTVSNFNLNASASSVDTIFGDNIMDGTDVIMKLGASSVSITIPQSIGVRAQVNSGLSSRDFQDFKSLGGGAYESSNYSSATKKINLSIDAGVSSITIKRS